MMKLRIGYMFEGSRSRFMVVVDPVTSMRNWSRHTYPTHSGADEVDRHVWAGHVFGQTTIVHIEILLVFFNELIFKKPGSSTCIIIDFNLATILPEIVPLAPSASIELGRVWRL